LLADGSILAFPDGFRLTLCNSLRDMPKPEPICDFGRLLLIPPSAAGGAESPKSYQATS